MPEVFRYASNQIFGMQFADFIYRQQGVRYVWQVHPAMVVVMQCLLTRSATLTEWLFNRLVKVESI